MKVKGIFAVLFIASLSTAYQALAHDPKEHMKTAEQPECSHLEKMDKNAMNNDDPIMQAMMKKCMDYKHHHDESGASEDQNHERMNNSNGHHSGHKD